MARIINQLPLTSNNIWFYPGAPGTKGLRFPCAGNLCFIFCENAGRKRGNYADIFTGKTRGWNTGCSGKNQNLHKVMQRHLRKQSKVILVTKDKGKCVFPARRTMPRKEASANPGCPMVYHMKWNCECKNHPDWHVPYKYMNRKTISYTERNIKKIDQMATLMMPGEIKSFVEDDYSYLLTSVL